jgi:hypothetical protein
MGNDKLLLIWEEVPEKTTLFVLDSASEQAGWARESAGLFINCSDIAEDHSIEKLSDWLGEQKEVEPLSIEAVAEGPFKQVVVCGIVW